MSIMFDNRSRIGTRIKQLHTGKRHAQNPASELRQLITNVELLEPADSADVRSGANFIVYESRERGVTLWAGRSEYRLRRTEDGAADGLQEGAPRQQRPAAEHLSFLI